MLVGKYICLHAYTPINAWIHISHRYAYIGKERAFSSITQMLSPTETLANYYNRLCSRCNPQAHALFLKHPPPPPCNHALWLLRSFALTVSSAWNTVLGSLLTVHSYLLWVAPKCYLSLDLSWVLTMLFTLTSVIYLSHCIVLGFCSAPSQGSLTPSK